MARKKDAAVILAEKMVQVLGERRSLGADSYPLTLVQLASLTDPEAAPELVKQAAAKKKPFGERVIAVRVKDLDSPVALAEDAEQLASSSRTLEFVLTAICTPTEPTCDAARRKTVLSTKLRKPFETALARRIEAGELPVGISVLMVEKKKLLYLDRYPPPPPPEVTLADDLLQVLQSHRQTGGDAYPLTLAELVALGRPGAKAGVVQRAFALPAFSERVLIALKKRTKTDPGLNSPVVLAEDRESLVNSPALLAAVVTLSRTDAKQAFSVAELQKKVVLGLAADFGAALRRQVESVSLPPTVGCLPQRGKPLFFLLGDVRGGKTTQHMEPVPVAPSTPSFDFGSAFDAAFERLDRQRGHNFVSLVDLRQTLRAERQIFDAGLHDLRRAGRYTLSAAEGRDGISPEENEAGIREDGSLLLYVSRRLP